MEKNTKKIDPSYSRILDNWYDLSCDLIEEGFSVPEVIKMISENFRLDSGLLTEKLKKQGLIAE